jgi:hypothetical protein
LMAILLNLGYQKFYRRLLDEFTELKGKNADSTAVLS